MSVQFVVLERSIRHNLAAIERLYAAIGDDDHADGASEDELIVLGYRLHNLYCAMERILQDIGAAFEDRLDDPSQWQGELLRRMQWDLKPLRPAVIDADTYDALDELRRFRHQFRYGWDAQPDLERLRLVLHKARQLRDSFPVQIDRFLSTIR